MGVIYSKLQGKPAPKAASAPKAAPATGEDKSATKPTPKKNAKK